MKEVKVKKDELLQVLKANLASHQKVFEEALASYKDKVVATLEQQIDKARQGKRVPESIYIARPVNQSHEYRRAIRMMEMSVEPEIVLTTQEFDAYVMDRWLWKQDFLTKNSAYSATATRMLESQQED